jgi:hypothetical protein
MRGKREEQRGSDAGVKQAEYAFDQALLNALQVQDVEAAYSAVTTVLGGSGCGRRA